MLFSAQHDDHDDLPLAASTRPSTSWRLWQSTLHLSWFLNDGSYVSLRQLLAAAQLAIGDSTRLVVPKLGRADSSFERPDARPCMLRINVDTLEALQSCTQLQA